MVNNVIGVVNYVIAARPSLLNFMIADSNGRYRRAGSGVARQQAWLVLYQGDRLRHLSNEPASLAGRDDRECRK